MYSFAFRKIYTSSIAGGERKILQSFVCASLSSTRRKPCLGNLASSASASKEKNPTQSAGDLARKPETQQFWIIRLGWMPPRSTADLPLENPKFCLLCHPLVLTVDHRVWFNCMNTGDQYYPNRFMQKDASAAINIQNSIMI
ncbi:hypothetical protein Tco_1461967, partial [Tanacetum coccineum]